MKHTKIFCFTGMILLLCLTDSGWGQSEHVKKMAEGFKKLYPYYATDILTTKPDFIVFTPKQHLKETGDTYNDHFHVFDKPNGKMFAVWTQATREAYIDQHIAFSRSTDKGLTWSTPQILAGSRNADNPSLVASWQQPMVSKSGRIYVFWVQQVSNTPNACCGDMFGIYSDNDGDTWSAPRKVNFTHDSNDTGTSDPTPIWCNSQRPLRLGENGHYLTGSSRHINGRHYRVITEFYQYDNIDDDPKVEDVHIKWLCQGEKGLAWDKGWAYCCEESHLVKLPDGRLFALMRTGANYPVWSVSSDQGHTWTTPEPLRDRDGGNIYPQPKSPCPLYDRKGPEAGSGYYFGLVHNAIDPKEKQKRGPVYLIAGKFQPDAHQPIWFAPPQLFIDRPNQNSLYTSCTVVDGKTVLWYGDRKFYLLGRYISDEWFSWWNDKK